MSMVVNRNDEYDERWACLSPEFMEKMGGEHVCHQQWWKVSMLVTRNYENEGSGHVCHQKWWEVLVTSTRNEEHDSKWAWLSPEIMNLMGWGCWSPDIMRMLINRNDENDGRWACLSTEMFPVMIKWYELRMPNSDGNNEVTKHVTRIILGCKHDLLGKVLWIVLWKDHKDNQWREVCT